MRAPRAPLPRASDPSDRVAPRSCVVEEARRTPAATTFPGRAGLAALLLGLVAEACVPTLKTPLKQALPSVLGEEGAAAPCWREVGTVALPGPALAGTLADLDGNGGLDLAAHAVVDGAPALVFAFNDGRGQLGRTTSLRLNGSPIALRAADVNLDGYVDLVVASNSAVPKEPSALHVLLGDGAGGFIAGATALPFQPSALWVADLDGNEVMDALVLDHDGSAGAILLGDGRGEFAVKGRFRLPGKVQPGALAVADLNGDRIADLASLHVRGNGKAILTIHRGRGDDFKPWMKAEIGEGPGSVAAGDLNRDGHPDLVALTAGGGAQPSAVLLLGNGVPELDFMGVRYFGPPQSRSLQLADVTGDGFVDAVSLRAAGDGIDTIPGDRRGGLGKLGGGPIGAGILVSLLGDLNRDGRPEIVVLRPDQSGAAILQPTACAAGG
ncbi:MAG: VCBS repeat-containing protein [Nannocystaceae bacterium]